MATGLSVVVPLIHGLSAFGLDLMNKKAFSYTMVAKLGCLLSGTLLYAVSLPYCTSKRTFDPDTSISTRPDFPKDGGLGNSICVDRTHSCTS